VTDSVLGRHEDDRGVIQDLLVTSLDAVTRITSVKDAIRGNHYHAATVQWTLVISGRLLVVTQRLEEDGSRGPREERVYGPREMACEEPMVIHAWHSLTDTEVLVFTKGPRAGEAYEGDTFRLPGTLL
jgi:dTDP-4-dehydrorhamnose 3,5-epimerase-like enzyme